MLAIHDLSCTQTTAGRFTVVIHGGWGTREAHGNSDIVFVYTVGSKSALGGPSYPTRFSPSRGGVRAEHGTCLVRCLSHRVYLLGILPLCVQDTAAAT